jgi:phosphate uptake regulator
MPGRPRRPIDGSGHGRDATLAQVIEVVDESTPETKSELAGQMGLSAHYLSELLQELKRHDVVSKGYVVDRQAVYEAAPEISNLGNSGATDGDLLANLRRLESVTTDQYRAARAVFAGETPDQSPDQLEALTNERTFTVLNELKSVTLTTDWPGNRVAADLATVARNFEVIGDRACFIADVVERDGESPRGVIGERILDVFDAGLEMNDLVSAILFDYELDRIDDLYEREEQVHRDLSELFEMATAYTPQAYGDLVAVTRALERAIYYWVNTAEVAVRIHSGIELDHLSLSSSY